MSLSLPAMTNSEMSAESSYGDGVVRIALAGNADVDAKADLEATIKKLHEESLRLAPSKVVVDLRKLEFMNSSCFKVFVSWLAQVRDLPPEKQYRIHLVSNPALHWQRRSLAALSCFAIDLVAIET